MSTRDEKVTENATDSEQWAPCGICEQLGVGYSGPAKPLHLIQGLSTNSLECPICLMQRSSLSVCLIVNTNDIDNIHRPSLKPCKPYLIFRTLSRRLGKTDLQLTSLPDRLTAGNLAYHSNRVQRYNKKQCLHEYCTLS